MATLSDKIYNERLKYAINMYSIIGFGIFAAGYIEPLNDPTVVIRFWTSAFGLGIMVLGVILFLGLRDV
ncbi:hypothetical protein [uncultured Ruegeria sp.]|uniref:hypothetical protein n=1 Tax=uncultured Ruegeria sp. TaxID=259304 RepID=UPI0026239573|nr:hypothetical protein [uncultured Ruegeria sp.]